MMIQHVMTKYQHTHMAFVKALNKLLVEQLFKLQDVQELNNPENKLNNPENKSSIWVKHLYGLVDQLNDTETQMTGMKPNDAIELEEVPLVESYPPENMLPEDGLYCYLLQPGEEHEPVQESNG